MTRGGEGDVWLKSFYKPTPALPCQGGMTSDELEKDRESGQFFCFFMCSLGFFSFVYSQSLVLVCRTPIILSVFYLCDGC